MLANEEFYENLREGMKSAEDPVHFEPETHKKYSHHLGRAEFGTLKKKISNAASRDASADRFKPNVGSRDPSAEKRFNSTSKLSGQSSKDQIRSDSRQSDYGTALPDLEVDVEMNNFVVDNMSNTPIHRTQSLLLGSEQEEKPTIVDSNAEVLAIREEVLKEMEERKQQVRETKGIGYVLIYQIFLIMFCSLDTKWVDDRGWVWCDGLSADTGSCGWRVVAEWSVWRMNEL